MFQEGCQRKRPEGVLSAWRKGKRVKVIRVRIDVEGFVRSTGEKGESEGGTQKTN